MSVDQPAGRHHDAVAASPVTVVSTWIVRSRSVPVSGSVSPVELEPDARQHRQGAASAGHGPAGGAERLDEDVTFTSELHRSAFPLLMSR